MSRILRFLQEIHRRSVWQILLVYLGVSYAVLEAVDLFVERLALPGWFFPAAATLLLIGLPIVLTTALVQGGPGDASIDRDGGGADAGPGAVGQESVAEVWTWKWLTWRKTMAGGVVVLALSGGLAAAWLLLSGRSDDTAIAELDPAVVAVLPFRVAGASPEVEYLKEGMVDLLAAKLTGEGGPRAVDPRAAVSAWRRAIASESDLTEAAFLDIAGNLGAGRLLLGGLVGTGDHIVLNATLLMVPGGATAALASVEGSTDALTALVDNLTAQLLAGEAGESQQRLAALTSTSLPALRAYLQGQATYRRGQYLEAEQQFRTALQLDSTFALAALGYVSARFWTVNGFDPDGIRLAWSHRERLSQRDRALLIALAGPEYPRASPLVEALAALERAVESAPDRPEGWYWLGEVLYHNGQQLGLAAAHDRAADAFNRSVELDSAFSAPLSHLIDVAIMKGDRARHDRLLSLYLEVNPTGEFRNYEIWQSALTFGDTATLDSVRALFPEMSTIALRAIIRTTELKGLPTADAEAAEALLRGRAGTPTERIATLSLLHDYELDRGRPSQALAILEMAREIAPDDGRLIFRIRVLDALYGGGDSVAAALAVSELEPYAIAPLSDDVRERASQYADICTVEQWRLWHETYESVSRSIDRLRSTEYPSDSSAVVDFAHTCADMLEAMHATFVSRPGSEAFVAQLDEKLRTAPAGIYLAERLDRTGNLVVAQLLELHGQRDAAYRALQRREFFNTRYLASFLREEGRLAALLGYREAAIRAYRHYLTLRSDPEPPLLDEVERVRAELARLTGEPEA